MTKEQVLAQAAEDTYPIRTLSEFETNAIHGWMESLFRSHGLQGPELDEAVATCFRVACISIDGHRLAKHAVRSNLRLVQ
jgi:hypothetical protein